MAASCSDHVRPPAAKKTFLMRRFPELMRIPDPRVRQALCTAAYRTVRWRLLAFTALFVLTAIPLGILAALKLPDLLGGYVGLSGDVIAGVAGGLIGPLTPIVVVYVFHRTLKRALREQMVSHGVAICLVCGYDLRGLTEPRCPECGTSFDPRLLKRENTGASHEQ